MLFSLDKVLSVLEEENRFSGKDQLGLFGDTKTYDIDLPDLDEMDTRELLSLEKQATGMYLSGHPMSVYTAAARKSGCTQIIDIVSGKVKDGARVRVMGILDSVRVKALKSGATLTTAKIEDVTAAADVTVFSAAYEAYRQYLTEGATVEISGKVSEREDRNTEIILESVRAVDETFLSAISEPERLKIRVSSIKGADFMSAQRILERFPGGTQVIVFCRDTGKRLLAPERLFVKKDEKLLLELKRVLGEKNVKFE